MTHPLFFHRISRMNQRQSCLSDYSRNFAEFWPLANGSRQICAAVVFFVTQISQMTQIFLRGRVLSHRFHRYTQIFLNLRRIALSNSRGYLQRPNRSPPRNSVLSDDEKNLRHLRNLRDLKNIPRKICVNLWNLWDFFRSQGVSFLRGIIFVPQISQIYTDFFESLVNRFVRSQGVSATTGQVASAKFRVIRWIKKSASSAKSAWLKKRPKKNLCISVKSVGQKNKNLCPLKNYE